MKTFVFLGPSLAVDEARCLCDAVYLPPVQMGDVYRLVEQLVGDGEAGAIAIIDGVFEQVPAVFHKEILFALSHGVPVLGAASMGALRAAELAPFGMEGVGAVFAAFRSGELTDDDEVAVAHAAAEDGFRPLSEAMVNLRAGLRLASAEGVIAPATADRLVGAAKAMFYPDRSWPAVLAWGRAHALPEMDALGRFVRARRPDAKGDDARALLRQLAAGPPAARRCDFTFERPRTWERMTQQMKRTAGGMAHERVRRHVEVALAGREQVVREALLLWLLERSLEDGGIEVSDSEVAVAAERFRRARGLESAADTERWLADNGLSLDAFDALIRREAAAGCLIEAQGPRLTGFVIESLQRSGAFPAVAAAVERKHARLAALGLENPAPADARVDAAQLLDWYHAHVVSDPAVDLDTRARRGGFVGPAELLTEITAEYLTRAC